MNRTWWLFLLGCGLLAWGTDYSPAAENKGPVVDLGGLKSRIPADWKEMEPTAIQRQGGRIKHFIVPKAGDDKLDADVLVFFFQGQGGSVKENVQRWKGMFNPPEGKNIDDATKIEEMKVGKVGVTYVDIQGTYKYKKAPFVPDAQAELRPDHRMIAVYFDSKNGPFFMRFVGPAKTVEQHKKGFDDWLKAFE